MGKQTKELLIEELIAQAECDPRAEKDILVVCRDQGGFVRECVESIFKHTLAFTLHLWDNGSAPETADYLRGVAAHANVRLYRSEANEGFIVPNNRLAAAGSAPWLVLLNSDTRVLPGWDTALVGYLQAHPDVAVAGYEGGLLSSEGMGVQPWHGDEVDYVMGWSLAVSRATYDRFGLFDETNLRFAYCEDSDLCLRVREAGLGVYALNMHGVVHHANQTARQVRRERDIQPDFVANHEYIKRRWAGYLAAHRTLARYPDFERSIMHKAGLTPAEVAAGV